MGSTEDAFQCFDNLPGVARQTTSVTRPCPRLGGAGESKAATTQPHLHHRLLVQQGRERKNDSVRHLHMLSFKPSYHAGRESFGTLELCPSHRGMHLRPRAIVCVRSMPRHRPGCTACCQLRAKIAQTVGR
jgi:hypothetical protein